MKSEHGVIDKTGILMVDSHKPLCFSLKQALAKEYEVSLVQSFRDFYGGFDCDSMFSYLQRQVTENCEIVIPRESAGQGKIKFILINCHLKGLTSTDGSELAVKLKGELGVEPYVILYSHEPEEKASNPGTFEFLQLPFSLTRLLHKLKNFDEAKDEINRNLCNKVLLLNRYETLRYLISHTYLEKFCKKDIPLKKWYFVGNLVQNFPNMVEELFGFNLEEVFRDQFDFNEYELLVKEINKEIQEDKHPQEKLQQLWEIFEGIKIRQKYVEKLAKRWSLIKTRHWQREKLWKAYSDTATKIIDFIDGTNKHELGDLFRRKACICFEQLAYFLWNGWRLWACLGFPWGLRTHLQEGLAGVKLRNLFFRLSEGKTAEDKSKLVSILKESLKSVESFFIRRG